MLSHKLRLTPQPVSEERKAEEGDAQTQSGEAKSEGTGGKSGGNGGDEAKEEKPSPPSFSEPEIVQMMLDKGLDPYDTAARDSFLASLLASAPSETPKEKEEESKAADPNKKPMGPKPEEDPSAKSDSSPPAAQPKEEKAAEEEDDGGLGMFAGGMKRLIQAGISSALKEYFMPLKASVDGMEAHMKKLTEDVASLKELVRSHTSDTKQYWRDEERRRADKVQQQEERKAMELSLEEEKQREQESAANAEELKADADKAQWLCKAIQLFRDPLELDISPDIPKPTPFESVLRDLVRKNEAFITDAGAKALVEKIMQRALKDSKSDDNVGKGGVKLDTEMVQEKEQETQKKKQKEVKKVKQQVVQYARHGEQVEEWNVDLLKDPHTLPSSLFHRLSHFEVSETAKSLDVNHRVLLSENYAHAVRIPNLPRRLKNVTVVLQWQAPMEDGAYTPPRYVCVNLAEAQSLRRALHTKHPAIHSGAAGAGAAATVAKISLLLTNGRPIDLQPPEALPVRSPALGYTLSTQAGETKAEEADEQLPKSVALALLRYFNAEVWFSEEETIDLVRALNSVPMSKRLEYFTHLLVRHIHCSSCLL